MVFGESPIKDAYRLLIWGPWRVVMRRAPAGTEVHAHRMLGRVACRLAMDRRERIRSHLRAALGEQPELDTWVREVFETHFSNQYVGLAWGRISASNVEDYVNLEGGEHIDAALRRGKGVVVAHPHMGLPQLPLHCLGLRGYDVHQVGGGRTAVELSHVGRWSAGVRASLENDICATLHDGKEYVRPLLRNLRENAIVFTACDGTGGGEELGRRERAIVFGHAMAMPVFPAWLAEKSGAALVFLTTCRNRTGRALFRAECAPPVEASGITAKTERIAVLLEGALRAHPGDWHFWDQWHSQPGGLLLPQTDEHAREATAAPRKN